MNTLSIADYSGADAECGDSGIAFAGLELTDIPGRDPGADVSCSPRAPARAAGFLFADGYGRDPDKYLWLPPDPPRIPRGRIRDITPLFWAVLGIIFTIDMAALYGVACFVVWVRRVAG